MCACSCDPRSGRRSSSRPVSSDGGVPRRAASPTSVRCSSSACGKVLVTGGRAWSLRRHSSATGAWLRPAVRIELRLSSSAHPTRWHRMVASRKPDGCRERDSSRGSAATSYPSASSRADRLGRAQRPCPAWRSTTCPASLPPEAAFRPEPPQDVPRAKPGIRMRRTAQEERPAPSRARASRPPLPGNSWSPGFVRHPPLRVLPPSSPNVRGSSAARPAVSIWSRGSLERDGAPSYEEFPVFDPCPSVEHQRRLFDLRLALQNPERHVVTAMGPDRRRKIEDGSRAARKPVLRTGCELRAAGQLHPRHRMCIRPKLVHAGAATGRAATRSGLR